MDKSHLVFINEINSYENMNYLTYDLIDDKIRIEKSKQSEKYYDYQINMNNVEKYKIYEGRYYYFSGAIIGKRFKDGMAIESAARDEYVRKVIALNNIMRGEIVNIYKKLEKNNIIQLKPKKVFSYFINVGHGNCSVVLLIFENKVELWMIDCSRYDKRNGKDYGNNINKCFDYIKKKYTVGNININKLFITHPHSDHINGLEELVSGGVFDNSEVWINAYYSWPTREYNNLLLKLKEPHRNISFINPISKNNKYIGRNIEIWHPNNIMVRRKYAYHPESYEEEISANNSSAVYMINIMDKSILYPGDIEDAGWNRISNIKICRPSMKSVNYYCLSHHGSNNGHRRTCSCRKINKVSDCFKGAPEIVFVMGRNRAYSNIFNNNVLNDFINICPRQHTTDPIYERQNNRIIKGSFSFIELDWSTSNSIYH